MNDQSLKEPHPRLSSSLHVSPRLSTSLHVRPLLAQGDEGRIRKVVSRRLRDALQRAVASLENRLSRHEPWASRHDEASVALHGGCRSIPGGRSLARPRHSLDGTIDLVQMSWSRGESVGVGLKDWTPGPPKNIAPSGSMWLHFHPFGAFSKGFGRALGDRFSKWDPSHQMFDTSSSVSVCLG